MWQLNVEETERESMKYLHFTIVFVALKWRIIAGTMSYHGLVMDVVCRLAERCHIEIDKLFYRVDIHRMYFSFVQILIGKYHYFTL